MLFVYASCFLPNLDADGNTFSCPQSYGLFPNPDDDSSSTYYYCANDIPALLICPCSTVFDHSPSGLCVSKAELRMRLLRKLHIAGLNNIL